MKNTIVLEKIQGGTKRPDTGRTVNVYEYNASDTAGAAPNGSLIANSLSEVTSGSGLYEINLNDDKKVTVSADGKAVAGLVGVKLFGEALAGGY